METSTDYVSLLSHVTRSSVDIGISDTWRTVVPMKAAKVIC